MDELGYPLPSFISLAKAELGAYIQKVVHPHGIRGDSHAVDDRLLHQEGFFKMKLSTTARTGAMTELIAVDSKSSAGQFQTALRDALQAADGTVEEIGLAAAD